MWNIAETMIRSENDYNPNSFSESFRNRLQTAYFRNYEGCSHDRNFLEEIVTEVAFGPTMAKVDAVKYNLRKMKVCEAIAQ